LLLVVAALFVPHTFEISSQNIPDAMFIRYSVITLVLTVFYEYGSTLAGPYSTLSISLPTAAPLVNGLALIINIAIILSMWGLMRGRLSRRSALYIVALALCVHAFLLLGVLSVRVDGWLTVLAIPAPIFPILGILLILSNKIPTVSS